MMPVRTTSDIARFGGCIVAYQDNGCFSQIQRYGKHQSWEDSIAGSFTFAASPKTFYAVLHPILDDGEKKFSLYQFLKIDGVDCITPMTTKYIEGASLQMRVARLDEVQALRANVEMKVAKCSIFDVPWNTWEFYGKL